MRLTMVLLTPPGMAHKESTLSRQQALALGMLPTEAGVQAMSAVLAAPWLQLPVLGGVPQAYWHVLMSHAAPPLPHLHGELGITQLGASSQPRKQVMPVPAAAPHVPAVDVEAAVRSAAASVLGTTELDEDKPLALQGMDSLAGLDLRHKIQARGGGVLGPTNSILSSR